MLSHTFYTGGLGTFIQGGAGFGIREAAESFMFAEDEGGDTCDVGSHAIGHIRRNSSPGLPDGPSPTPEF